MVKISDDYQAKVRLWVTHLSVAPAPPPPRLPKFSPKKFKNHVEMNLWKRDLLEQLAREWPLDG